MASNITQWPSALTLNGETMNPVLGMAHNATTGHLIGTLSDGTTIDGGMPNTRGNISYMNYATGGGTISAAAGVGVICLTGAGVLAAQTVQLPPTPQDCDLVRVCAIGALSITLLTIQSATGAAVTTGVALGILSSMLFQYQVSAWVRIG